MPQRDAEMETQFVPMLFAHAKQAGLDPAVLVAAAGLPPEVASGAVGALPPAEVRALADTAERLLEDPALGLHVARGRARGSLGVVEFVARSAPTLLAAAERFLRYQRLVNTLAVFSIDHRAEGIAVEHHVPGERHAGGRHVNEFTVTLLLDYCRDLAGIDVVPRRAWFAHETTGDLDALVNVMGTRTIEFARGSNGILIDAAVFTRPVSTADPALLRVLDQHAELLLRASEPPTDTRSRVRARVREALARGERSTVESVSAAMRMSVRTLHRRLADDGTTFQVVLDDVRRDLALGYISDRGLAVGEMAFLLGYADVRSFLRAFKRWTGTTPAQYRAGASVRPQTTPPEPGDVG